MQFPQCNKVTGKIHKDVIYFPVLLQMEYLLGSTKSWTLLHTTPMWANIPSMPVKRYFCPMPFTSLKEIIFPLLSLLPWETFWMQVVVSFLKMTVHVSCILIFCSRHSTYKLQWEKLASWKLTNKVHEEIKLFLCFLLKIDSHLNWRTLTLS